MFENFREMWARAGAGAQAALVLGVALIVAAVAYFAYLAMRSDYQVLFSDLEPRDHAAIVTELDRMKVPYVLGSDGTSILVDAQQVHATRIKLMGKGVNLQGGVGFELFNNTDFGMTEFAQKINYQRALQGELARTIMAMEEVKHARVHLVLPDTGVLKRAKQTPKASISLAMRDGRTLTPAQVLGIQRLVAAAVPEIDPSGVTIVDQRGVALTRPADASDEEGGAAYRMTVKGDIEKELTRKVVAVLDRAFGPGQAIVSVDVTVNTDQVRVTREDVLPHSKQGTEATGVVTRRRSVTRPGVRDKDYAGDGGSTTEVEYQSGRRVEQIVSRPGNIGRLSVGVLLPRELEAAKLKEVRQIISMTVGLNPARGDEIAISSVEGLSQAKPVTGESIAQVPATRQQAPERSEPADASAPTAWPLELIIAAALVVLLCGLLIGVIGMRLRSRPSAPPPALDPEARERLLAEMREWLRSGADPLARGDRRA